MDGQISSTTTRVQALTLHIAFNIYSSCTNSARQGQDKGGKPGGKAERTHTHTHARTTRKVFDVVLARETITQVSKLVSCFFFLFSNTPYALLLLGYGAAVCFPLFSLHFSFFKLSSSRVPSHRQSIQQECENSHGAASCGYRYTRSLLSLFFFFPFLSFVFDSFACLLASFAFSN